MTNQEISMRGFTKTAASRGVLLCSALFSFVGTADIVCAQEYRYFPEHRPPLDATIHDLEAIAAHNTYSGKERQRYDNALRHVSQFARRFQEGRFDKDKLDDAIGDVQHVIDKNPMDGRAREILCVMSRNCGVCVKIIVAVIGTRPDEWSIA
jgi:hypothetical protein